MENKENDCIGPTKEQFKDWMAMWHVEIEERPRHLWPNKWIISGWYVYEKYLYKNAEYKWEKEEEKQIEAWNNKNKQSIEEAKFNGQMLTCSYDYFHWNVETYSWSLHKDGIWYKSLISDSTGIFDSYEEAVTTLAKLPALPNRFEDYENHLEEALQRKMENKWT